MIIERILEFIEYKGINRHKFYKETGLSNGFLDKVKDIGSSRIEKILQVYPEISPEWILLGKGKMLKFDSKEALTLEQIDFIVDAIHNHNKQLEENSIFRTWKDNIEKDACNKLLKELLIENRKV